MIVNNFQSSSSSAHSAQIPEQSHAPLPLKTFGTFLGRSLMNHLQPLEPTVSKKRDRHGNVYWHIYDPHTRTASVFTSENEARAYLEKRHLLASAPMPSAKR